MNRKLRMGMVGGGRGAFIGTVHRIAAAMDNRIELVCGALSSTPEKSIASGKDWLLPRVYGTYEDMFWEEKKLPVGERMDFVAIVTPNHLHFPVAMAALDSGFHVVCDKPMTLTLAEAKKLAAKVKQTGLLFCLTHNYTGYPMVKEARDLVASGQLGKIRKIVAEYPQGWLATLLEASGQKQADWRTDPKRAGACCCMGDIGTHAENLAEYITGLQITEMCADLTTFVKGRKLEDDGNLLVHYNNGARGIIWASQIAVGRENGLNIRVFGEKGALEWHQQEPNTLIVDWPDRPRELRRTNTGPVGAASKANSRVPAGHPEGYLEGFANIYTAFAKALADVLDGKKVRESDCDYPDVRDGVRGMAFLDTVVKSAKSKNKWTQWSA
jgi:predicted dehydrogenase